MIAMMKENTSLRGEKNICFREKEGEEKQGRGRGAFTTHKNATPRSPCYCSLIASERKQLPFFSQPELGFCSGSITTYLYDLERIFLNLMSTNISPSINSHWYSAAEGRGDASWYSSPYPGLEIPWTQMVMIMIKSRKVAQALERVFKYNFNCCTFWMAIKKRRVCFIIWKKNSLRHSSQLSSSTFVQPPRDFQKHWCHLVLHSVATTFPSLCSMQSAIMMDYTAVQPITDSCKSFKCL